MPSLKKYVPQLEAELHLLIQEQLEDLEEGLRLLKHEYPTSGSGIIDFLCVDSGGRLVIIEVKLHEDENILFQGLRYFSAVDGSRYVIANAFSDQQVNPEESPRIVLIAESFSSDLKRLSTLVRPDVELYEYTVVTLPGGDRGVVFHSVSLPVAERPPAEATTVDGLIAYLRAEELKPVLDAARRTIKSLAKGIEEYATQGYIGYKHSSGRQFAYIKVYRKSIGVGAHTIDEKKQLLGYDDVRIESPSETWPSILEKMKVALANLGASLN